VGFEDKGSCYTSAGIAQGADKYSVWCPLSSQCKGTPSESIPNGAWPADGCDGLSQCKGKCNTGFSGSPYATCADMKGSWSKVSGQCISSGTGALN
jgi:hypothetical protein